MVWGVGGGRVCVCDTIQKKRYVGCRMYVSDMDRVVCALGTLDILNILYVNINTIFVYQ